MRFSASAGAPHPSLVADCYRKLPLLAEKKGWGRNSQMKTIRRAAVYTLAILLAGPAFAQAPAPNAPAKELFGKKGDAAPLKARAIGFYSKGCLAGGVALPVNGSAWQVMRLSRNRNWGHPDLIAFLERFALRVPKRRGLERNSGRRPRAAPRWTDAHGSCLASGWAGCRHLADANAKPHAE